MHNGIDGTTIAQIARRARAAEGALYRHFKSKDDLAWYIFSNQLASFTAELMGAVLGEAAFEARVRRYVRHCFAAFDADRDLFTFLILTEHREFRSYPAAAMHPGLVAVKLVEDGQKEGAVPAGEPFLLAALFIGALIRACVAHSYGRIPGRMLDYEAAVSRSLTKMLQGCK